jgi:hypothetical protein
MMWQRFKLTLKRVSTFEYAPRYSRLAGDIACYEPQLQKRITDTRSEHEQWAIQAQVMLKQAKTYLQEFKIDEGWKSFHTTKRMEIFGMNKHERLALAKSICKEACKLREWRKDAILSLLESKKEEVAEAPDAEVLVQAAELKDDFYNNQYYINRLTHNLFWLLSGLLFLVLIAIIAYFLTYFKLYDKELGKNLNLSDELIGVVLFGLLGALTSAILFTRNLSKSTRIKEISSSQVIVLSKIFIGAGFSIFIFLLLRSSVAESIKLFSFSISTPLDFFAIAFASGFTEQLAQKSLDLIAGKENPDKSKPSASENTDK